MGKLQAHLLPSSVASARDPEGPLTGAEGDAGARQHPRLPLRAAKKDRAVVEASRHGVQSPVVPAHQGRAAEHQDGASLTDDGCAVAAGQGEVPVDVPPSGIDCEQTV
jgi:hypothetical protein